MFDRFGEFDSAEEINQKAEELLKAEDTDGIRTLAAENGIDVEDAEVYITGEETCLATAVMAAEGKLKVEAVDLKLEGKLIDWKNMILEICLDDSQICAAVRKKGKSLCACISAMISDSFATKTRVSDKIVKVTKVTHNGKLEPLRGPLYMDGLTNARAKQIIRDYYTK